MRTPQVPMDRVFILRGMNGGFDIQFGDLYLGVDSEEHWEDIAERVKQEFLRLHTLIPRQVPLPRTDNVKPTDYSSVNCSGACWGSEDE